MADIHDRCSCTSPLPDPLTLICGSCGKYIGPRERTRELWETTENITEGQPDRLPNGLYRHINNVADSEQWTRQEFITMAVGVLNAAAVAAGIVLGPWVTGVLNESRELARTQQLTEDDIQIAERDLSEGQNLIERAEFHEKERRFPVAKFYRALAAHPAGTDPYEAEKKLVELLTVDHSDIVKSSLLFHRARARTFSGKAEQGLDDLDMAIHYRTLFLSLYDVSV